jgi:2,3-bisphosphoglycerate-dependent phosphoglycerate mutase
MYKLVLIRHGESQWNLENRFTGWTDVELTATGVAQAKEAGLKLKANGYDFDLGYTSVLKRAIHTMWHTLDSMDRAWLPVAHHWRLNERHYGALQGLNKAETAHKFGDEQVLAWRRSYDVPPPTVTPDHEFHPAKDPRYRLLAPDALPASECLKDVVARVLPWWHDAVVPQLRAGLNVLVVAHGNSLRALIKHLERIADDAIVELNVPTGMPRLYRFRDDLSLAEAPRYLDEAAAKAGAEAVANQTKKG